MPLPAEPDGSKRRRSRLRPGGSAKRTAFASAYALPLGRPRGTRTGRSVLPCARSSYSSLSRPMRVETSSAVQGHSSAEPSGCRDRSLQCQPAISPPPPPHIAWAAPAGFGSQRPRSRSRLHKKKKKHNRGILCGVKPRPANLLLSSELGRLRSTALNHIGLDLVRSLICICATASGLGRIHPRFKPAGVAPCISPLRSATVKS